MAALILCAIGCSDPSAPMPGPQLVTGCYKIAFESAFEPFLSSGLGAWMPKAIALVDSLGTGFLNNGQKLVLRVPSEAPRSVGTWSRVDATNLRLRFGDGEGGVVFDLSWRRGWTGTATTYTDVANIPPVVERVSLLARGCS